MPRVKDGCDLADIEATTLGALFDAGTAAVQTGPFGSQLHSHEYVEAGVPVVATEAIGCRRLLPAGMPKITAHTAARLSRHRLQSGDIVLARRGAQATGLSALVDADHDGAICGTGALRLRIFDTTRVLPSFLSFALITEASRAWLRIHAVGAVMPNLNEGVIRRLPIRLPPLTEQRAIAAMLGALDDKIEVNRKMARVLEGIARAVFTSWFMDFDPVRRAAEGKPTGLPPDLAALFPKRLVDSPIGEVPEGWRVGMIGEMVEAVGGGTPSTAEPSYWDAGTYAFCTPKDMSSLSSSVLLGTERRVTDAGLAKINSGLLPAGTVVMSSRAPIGYLAINEIPLAVNQGIIAMKCSKGWSAEFVLRWCEAHMNEIEANANGSTFQEISKQNFRPIQTAIPTGEAITAFDRIARPLHERVVSCEREAAVLAALRDALLPKLISGELRIANAEEIVGRTA